MEPIVDLEADGILISRVVQLPGNTLLPKFNVIYSAVLDGPSVLWNLAVSYQTTKSSLALTIITYTLISRSWNKGGIKRATKLGPRFAN
jgi:hypothetical protein